MNFIFKKLSIILILIYLIKCSCRFFKKHINLIMPKVSPSDSRRCDKDVEKGNVDAKEKVIAKREEIELKVIKICLKKFT